MLEILTASGLAILAPLLVVIALGVMVGLVVVVVQRRRARRRGADAATSGP